MRSIDLFLLSALSRSLPSRREHPLWERPDRSNLMTVCSQELAKAVVIDALLEWLATWRHNIRHVFEACIP